MKTTPSQHVWLLLALPILCSCGRYIPVDRSQFVKDGEEFPTVDMGYYKSVQERPGQSADLATAIAISGGGLRASNFGIGIMLGLEAIGTDNGGNALQEVDYISTVSGGGFAGGAYISALFDHHYYHKNEPFSLENYVEQRIANDLTKSYTGVLLRNYFNPKVWFSTDRKSTRLNSSHYS